MSRDGRYDTRIIDTTDTDTYQFGSQTRPFLYGQGISRDVQECGYDSQEPKSLNCCIINFFWHCALISILLGREELVSFGIVSYHANTQYRIESSLAGIAHLYK